MSSAPSFSAGHLSLSPLTARFIQWSPEDIEVWSKGSLILFFN